MADLGKSQNYLNKDFEAIRSELIDTLKVYYPDNFQDFNAASIGMSLIDLLAYVSDKLQFNLDKKFNELFIDGISSRASAVKLAKTFGYKTVGNRSSVTLGDIIISVPALGFTPDPSYLPVYRAGLQAKGSGQVFETINEINFASDFSEDGTTNRLVKPVFNANQDILRYTITKREILKAGATLYFKKEISVLDASTPFLEVSISDTNVLEIVSVIAKPGTGQISVPTFDEFSDNNLKFHEVDDLATSKIFVNDGTTPDINNNIKSGKYIEVNQRFIKEFIADGSIKVTFGGGTPDVDGYQAYLSKLQFGEEDKINIKDTFDNMALGSKLPSNSTLWIKYRVGGGNESNIGSNVLQSVGNIDAVIGGSDSTVSQAVINSTTVTNPIPAIGGAGLPTIDEIRNNISSNFASQKRCITLGDYISRAYQIPGKFGAPFRIEGKVEDNKVKLYILTRDANGKVMTVSTNVVKNNITEYLSEFRSLNDFVEINDGKVINISIEATLLTDKTFNSN